MSELSVKAREAAKRKVERLTTDPHQKTDASSWTPPEPEDADVQTGPRPISKRQFKKGGLVVKGEHEKRRADRKPRKSGGRALVDDYVNRDVKEANEDRAGTKHVGGMKKGGSVSDGELEGTRLTGGRKAHKHGGRADAHWIKGAIKHPGALHRELNVADDKRIPEKKLEKAEHSPNKMVAKRAHLAETLRDLPRDGRKHGGKAGKGKMSVNIVIAPGGGQPQGAPPMAGPPMPPPHPIVPPNMPMGAPPGGMPAGAGGPPPMAAPPGAGMPPPGMMGRKHGGSVSDKLAAISAGAGGGLARLVKAKAASKSW